VIDEIEARLRRARSWHEERGFADGARIFGEMIDWMTQNGPAIPRRALMVT
jgi:hypothetical protein